jgi:hypothetical protein
MITLNLGLGLYLYISSKCSTDVASRMASIRQESWNKAIDVKARVIGNQWGGGKGSQ